MRMYATASITVYCRGCGEPRILTRRQARRAGLCRNCLYPPRDVRIQDRHRRYWFEKFTDHELSLLASGLAGRFVPAARIAEHRQALVAASSIRDVEGVASPGERAPRVLLSPPR